MENNKFGDFEVTENPENPNQNPQPEIGPQRIRMPRDKELIGIVVQRLGGNKMEVLATDGKLRNCRVPGRFKRTMWLKPKNIVIIKPWTDDDSKADMVYKYNPSAVNQLRKKGILDKLKTEF